jgi:hypothetical protein
MRFLKLLIYGLFTLLVLVLLIPVLLPDSVELSQSIKMTAEAKQVFRLVNDFENWKLWSPFELDKADVEARISTPSFGKGSMLVYKSNTASEGRITIIESRPYSGIKMMLDMQKGGTAIDEWTFEQNRDTLLVTWTLRLSELSYPFHRYFGFFSRSLMTPFQQKGLEKLKQVAMRMPPLLPADTIYHEGIKAIVTDLSQSTGAATPLLEPASVAVRDYLRRMRVSADGDLVAVYNDWKVWPPVNPLIGYLVAEETRESGQFRYIEYAGGPAVTTSVVGSSDRKQAYDELSLFVREFGLRPDSTKPVLEFYAPAASQTQVTRFVVFLKER